MAQGVSVTGATRADLPRIKQLILELLKLDYPDEADKYVDGALENCRALLDDPLHHVLVAKQGGNVVGFIHFTVRSAIIHPAPCGLIDELVVAEDRRGQGIGKQLVSAVLEKCRSLGCCEVEVSTGKNNTAARELYKKCGFEEYAVLLERHF